MKNSILGLLILFHGLASVIHAAPTLETLNKIGFPIVHITTVDGELPTCEYVNHPEGAMGHAITNANKVPASMVITLKGDTIYNSGAFVPDSSGITIKINGNTSAYKEVKPYKLKLQQKDDLLMRGDSAYHDKEWRLITEEYSLNTAVGLKVNEIMGFWTPQYCYCNVIINDEYKGFYKLIESVKRNTQCRINVKKTGYIVERDAYWWNEDLYFNSTYFADKRFGWTFKYPDVDKVTTEQIDYINQYINDAEKSIRTGNYPDYIDVESFASWLLAHDILGTWDTGGSNVFVTKADNTPNTKLKMGCLWDYGSSTVMSSNNWSRYHINDDFYFQKLLNNQNEEFRQAYENKWKEVRVTIAQELDKFLDHLNTSPLVDDINTSRILRFEENPEDVTTVETNVEHYKTWFEKHLKWMDSQLCSGINDLTIDSNVPHPTYNLQGIIVPDDTRGIVIRNHKIIKQ